MPKKGRKLPEMLTPRESDLRRQWFYQNGDDLVRLAADGFRSEGRGAIMVREEGYNPKTDQNPAVYMSDQSVQSSGLGWPDAKSTQTIKSYRPDSQFVVILLHARGEIDVYTVEFNGTTIRTVLAA
jgi:hypothetical protein